MQPRTYLITGSTGSGAETARQLADGGANLFICSRTEEHCRTLADELERLGAKTGFAAGDLTCPEVAARFVGGCVERFGRVDGLFNVAGISGRRYGDGPVHECTDQGWETTMATNTTTHYRMCREVVRVMLAQSPLQNGQRGVILNMSSILGLHPEPKHFDTHAYAAGKGAIVALTRSMASTYVAEKIRVNAIAPGLIRTAMSARACDDASLQQFIALKQPLFGGVIPLSAVASAAVFLLTDASLAVTGEILAVDGGWDLN